jgi:hypothetical protein
LNSISSAWNGKNTNRRFFATTEIKDMIIKKEILKVHPLPWQVTNFSGNGGYLVLDSRGGNIYCGNSKTIRKSCWPTPA